MKPLIKIGIVFMLLSVVGVIISSCKIITYKVVDKDYYPLLDDEILYDNSTWNQTINWSEEIEIYRGNLFYCFYSEYKDKTLCFPYTEEIKKEVIDAENITDYWVVDI